jgi:dTDP-4-amino-4,6-dideoxygalactose transaminase
MTRIEEFVARRREIAAAYDAAFADLPVTSPWQRPDTASAWHLYVIRIDRQRTSRSHREIFDALREAGIGVNLHYIPVYRQPYYRELGFGQGHCPNAEAYYAEAMSLPMYFGLSDDEQRQVVAAVAVAVAA